MGIFWEEIFRRGIHQGEFDWWELAILKLELNWNNMHLFFIYLFIYLLIYLFIYLSIYLFVCLLIYLFCFVLFWRSPWKTNISNRNRKNKNEKNKKRTCTQSHEKYVSFSVDLYNRQPHWFEETIGFDVKISSVSSHQDRWYNNRILRKSYSVLRGFSWFEN